MTSRSASVTGATGFLGWHVAEALRDRGWRVRGIVRPGSQKPLPTGVDRVEAPLEAARLAPAVAGSDVVVHCAALIRAARVRDLDRVNVAGTRAAVEAANRAGAAMLFVSSQAAIGPATHDRPACEDDPPHPVNPYGRSKAAAEQVVRESARHGWTIVRPCAIYGPRDRGFLALFRLAARGRFPLAASPSAEFTLIYADDAARATAMAAESPAAAGSALFIGGEAVAADVLLRAIARTVGREYRPRQIPRLAVRLAGVAGDAMWRLGRTPLLDSARVAELLAPGFVCAVDRAREQIGFTAETPLEQGLAATWRWYRESGWITEG